ncbi:MAG: PQQ-binding-like beta-propeller repeat protein, partial [Planctomycetota bacterium]
MFRLTRQTAVMLGVGLMALAAFPALPTPTALAQDPPAADQPVRPEITETARLKFISSAGDFGGIVKHPDGTARLWNFNPDDRSLQLFDPGYGRRLWTARVPNQIELQPGSSPILVGGGSLLLWSMGDSVFAFNGNDGSYLWTVKNQQAGGAWEILPVNALPDRVVLMRARTDPRTGALQLLQVRVIDARNGQDLWKFDDPKAISWPKVWRGYLIHSTAGAVVNGVNGDNVAKIIPLTSTDGTPEMTCDFVPNELSDATILTARYRKGLQRSRYFLPDSSGKLAEVRFEFDPALQVPKDGARVHIPAVDAPIVTAMWMSSTNPLMAKRTFLASEDGNVVKLQLLPCPDDVDHVAARVLAGGNLALMFIDGNRQTMTQSINLRTLHSNFILRSDQIKPDQSIGEPAQWPMFDSRFALVDAGSNIGYRADVRDPRLTSMRIINPNTGAVSKPRRVDERNLPYNLSGGEFGWLENDEMVICVAGKRGQLITEPAEGDKIPMARVLHRAQRWLVKQQNADGSFTGPTMVPLFSQLETLPGRGPDLGTTALAVTALTIAAPDESAQDGLERRGAVRRAVHWIAKQQNAQGMYQLGYSNMCDHLLALEALIRALPTSLNDTTAEHKTSMSKALRFTINSRRQDNSFRVGVDLPETFTIPQAPGQNGTAIKNAINNQDTGYATTMVCAHRAFKAGLQHAALRPLVQGELTKDLAWVQATLNNPNQMMAVIDNLALILAEFLDELPPQAMPGPRLMDAIADAMPRPMLIGHRGRVQGIWWYGVPSFGAL